MKKKRILVLGAGFAGMSTFRLLRKKFAGNRSIELALVNDKNYFLFTPLLHEVATGSIYPSQVVEPVRSILNLHKAHFCLGKVQRIERKKKQVILDTGSIGYDYLVMALGSATNYFGVPGAEEHSFTLKSLSDAIRLKHHFIATIERASMEKNRKERQKMLHFVVVGGGATGVELAAEMSDFFYKSFSPYYAQEVIQDIQITLIQRSPELVPHLDKRMRDFSLKSLTERSKVDVRLGTGVDRMDADSVHLDSGKKIVCGTKIWTAGIKPIELEFDDQIEKGPIGRYLVNDYYQSLTDDSIFVLGDLGCCVSADYCRGLPCTAQAAQKSSTVVAENVYRLIMGKDLTTFRYKSSGDLLSLGHWNALGHIGPFVFRGKFAWWLWRTIYLMKMQSWRKRIRIMVDWTLNLFSPRDISQF